MITANDIKRFYDELHKKYKENTWRPYKAYEIFLDYLHVKQNKKILDIGCGTGFLLKAAEERELITYGIDISKEAIKIAKKVAKKSKIYCREGEDLYFPNEFFDYVTCLGALEHFLDINKGVQEIVRVAKKIAKICIVVPNKNYIFWLKKKNYGTIQKDINENLFTLSQWSHILEKNGLNIEKIYQDRYLMKEINIFSSLNPIKIIKKIITLTILALLPLQLTYQFIFVCKKDEEE